jgi:hypothetical protein
MTEVQILRLIRKRRDELAPLVAEYERLKAADDALENMVVGPTVPEREVRGHVVKAHVRRRKAVVVADEAIAG